MGFRIHVRVHPQGHGRFDPRRLREGCQAPKLRLRLYVEATNVGVEGGLKLGGALSDPGEDDLRRIATGSQYPGELPAGHDVKARA